MAKIDYSPLWSQLEDGLLAHWLPDLQRYVEVNIYNSDHGHLKEWMDVLLSLPEVTCDHFDLVNGVIFNGSTPVDLSRLLKVLHPWRKGPLNLGGVEIDTEWRSDWKWNRLKDHVAPLEDRAILDIGCGNGYYLYRMLGAGAKLAVGIDPFLLYVMQFWAIRHFAPKELAAWVLPLGWEDLPFSMPCFDTVFSMGVLYHRRTPESFLEQLKNYLRPGGELVLETLVIDGKEGYVLIPEARYAKMRNVWYLPSVPTLTSELTLAGWKNVRCVDVTRTTVEEQRSTQWMSFESLSDFLDPANPLKTIEGYPASVRAIFLANKSE